MRLRLIPVLSCLALTCFLSACSSMTSLDEKAVENSPTHPKVSQRIAQIDAEEVTRGDPLYRPIPHRVNPAFNLPSGSLFNPKRAIGLYQPTNSYQVGDMILVKVEEKTSADKSLQFSSDKSGRFELMPVTLNAGPIQIGGNDLNAQYEQEKDFDSSASTQQNNSLKGDITVYVMEVKGNGNLLVAGEKWIALNTGEEYIRFSGEVRASDISNDNTISSVKVGNAHIEYSGVGEMKDNQEQSFLGKLFSVID